MTKTASVSHDLQSLRRDLRVTHQLLIDEIAMLTDDQLDWSPRGKAPSARQIIEHFIQAEQMLMDAARKMQLSVALEKQNGKKSKDQESTKRSQ
jgi:hypothetical protein